VNALILQTCASKENVNANKQDIEMIRARLHSRNTRNNEFVPAARVFGFLLCGATFLARLNYVGQQDMDHQIHLRGIEHRGE